jgi:hypothetical protein
MEMLVALGGLHNTYLTVLTVELRLPVVIVLLRGVIKSYGNIYRSEWALQYLPHGSCHRTEIACRDRPAERAY